MRLDWMLNRNYVGVPTPELVCYLNWLDDNRDWMLQDEQWTEFALVTIDAIQCELRKRRRMPVQEQSTNAREIIETLKAKLTPEGLMDVIGWYTEIEYRRHRPVFHCVMGHDQHPSGVIYLDQGSWWCFRCNHGGDAIDAIRILGNRTTGEAISALGRYLGIDTKPKSRQKRGGYAI